MKLAYAAIGWDQSIRRTAAQLRNLGYQGIEGFGLLDPLPDDIDLQRYFDNGFRFVGSYFAGSFVEDRRQQQEVDDFSRTCDKILLWGGELITVGGGRRLNNVEECWSTFLTTIHQMADVAENRGLRFCFHPHYNTLVFKLEEIDRLVSNTSPSVRLALDTGHIAESGSKVLETFQRFQKRLGHVHAKDFGNVGFCELGTGHADVRNVLLWLKAVGYLDWVTIELDASQEPLLSARRNRAFVRDVLGL